MNVVNLLECREMLGVLDAMKKRILTGELIGALLVGMDRSGTETTVFSGAYQTDPSAALRAALQVSWDLTKASDMVEAERKPLIRAV